MAYPAAHTKLEMRYTVSVLSRYMSNWTLEHWGLALKALMYGISTKEIGLRFCWVYCVVHRIYIRQ